MATSGFNIANLFRPVQQVSAAPAPAPAAAPAAAPAPAAASQQTQQQANSPLDAFKSLWETDPTKAAEANRDPFAAPLFNSDPNKIREAASQMNFAQELPPELMQRVMAGNDPQAVVEMVNAVAQKALATSLQLQAATTEQAGQRIGQRFKEAIPSHFREMQIQNQKPTNPVLNHPAAAPMLASVRQQLRLQNPDWSPEQIQSTAEQYLSEFATTLKENDPNTVASRKAAQDESGENMDWMQWAQSSATR